MNRIIMFSFSDSRMSATLQRIKKEAEDSYFFDEIVVLDESAFDNSFRKRFSKWIEENRRGYGYWIWKPYLIHKILNQINEGDYLIYLDAGCEINKKGRKRFDDYIQEVTNSELGILAFDTGLSDTMYAKGDLIDFFEMRNSAQIYSGQVMSGLIIIRKKDSSVSLIRDWEDIVLNNTHLIDDSFSDSPNFLEFKENRHDQAVLSLLIKKRGGGVIMPNNEVDVFPPTNRNWRRLKKTPFHAIRNRNGKSRLGNHNSIEMLILNAYWDLRNWLQDSISSLRVFLGSTRRKITDHN